MGWRRLGLLVLASWLAAVGVAYDQIADDAGLGWLAAIGSVVLVVAAAAIVVLFIWPTALLAFRVTATLGPAGIATRPLVVFVNYGTGYVESGWSVVLSVLVYGALTLTGGWLWIYRVGPWVGRQRSGVKVAGD